MAFSLSPATVEPAAPLTATGTGSRKRPTRIRVAESDPVMGNAILAEFTMPANGRFTKALSAPGGAARETSLVLQQKRVDGVWAQTASVKLLLATGGGGGTTPIPNPPPDPPPPDVTAPVFSNVAVGATGPTTATITLNTNELATVRVRYRAGTGVWQTTSYTASGLSHTINLTGLAPVTQYSVEIEGLDTAGNLRLDTGRSFTTPNTSPVTGYEIYPGTGTIAAALAAGQRDLRLRGAPAFPGVYRDAFGTTSRTDVVKLTAHPGETVIIDGTGLVPHFGYFGVGADWRIKGIRFQNFPVFYSGANGTAMFGIREGYLELDQCVVQFINVPMDSLCHIVYAQGTGSVLVRDSKLLNSIGAALTSYTGSATVTVLRSELLGKYRALLIYNGATTATDSILRATETATDVEVLTASATCTISGGSGGGANGAIRRVNV